MSSSKNPFVKASPGGADITVVPDESERRLQEIPIEEMRRIYGKGFRLLQKSGMSEAEKLPAAPIKVVLRKPREGLKDDDISGRRALDDHRTGSAPSEIDFEQIYRDLKRCIPSIKQYVETHGGSVLVKEIVDRVLRPNSLGISPRQFLVLSRLIGITESGLRLNEDGSQLMSMRPVSVSQEINCACGMRFKTSYMWLSHVVQELDVSHSEYETRLLRIGSFQCACLVCSERKFTNILRLLEHCRSIGDSAHLKLGKAVVVSQLDPIEGTSQLMLTAIEYDDKQFPWQSLLGIAADPLENIPFDPGPPTPIYIDDDGDIDVMEVVDIASDLNNPDFINLED